MDEPLSNLDAKLRSNMRAEIIKIHNTLGATTIYVTHDQTEAMTMADRIVVMKKGIVQQVGIGTELNTAITFHALLVAGLRHLALYSGQNRNHRRKSALSS